MSSLTPQQKINILTVVVIVLLIAMIGFAYAAVVQTLRIRSEGEVKTIGVEVYADVGLLIPVNNINWSVLEPGDVRNLTVYVKNAGSAPSNLSMWTDAWNPPVAETYIALTWDYDGTILEPGQVIPVVLTLTVDTNITGVTKFSFDIWISAEG